MRQLIYIILTLHLVVPPFAQEDSARMGLIEDAIKSRNGDSLIVYLDSSFTLGEFDRRSKNGIVGYRGGQKVILKVESKEIAFLNRQLRNNIKLSWAPDMFKNSVMVSQETLDSIFARNRLTGLVDLYDVKRFYCFTAPIFTRDKSIAVFRLAEMYGISAGHDLLFFYKKSRGEWNQFMVSYIGAW